MRVKFTSKQLDSPHVAGYPIFSHGFHSSQVTTRSYTQDYVIRPHLPKSRNTLVVKATYHALARSCILGITISSRYLYVINSNISSSWLCYQL